MKGKRHQFERLVERAVILAVAPGMQCSNEMPRVGPEVKTVD